LREVSIRRPKRCTGPSKEGRERTKPGGISGTLRAGVHQESSVRAAGVFSVRAMKEYLVKKGRRGGERPMPFGNRSLWEKGKKGNADNPTS